jgi:hypothetical protein
LLADRIEFGDEVGEFIRGQLGHATGYRIRYTAKLGGDWAIMNRPLPTQTPDDSVRLICPRCRSRLEVLETTSGGRTVSVMGLGESVSSDAKALELFLAPDAGPDIKCPACAERFDPSSPYRRFPRMPR